MNHTHAFEWSEMLQQYVCGCGVTHYARLERTEDSSHIVYVFRGHECLLIDTVPYSTLNEAKDHADWMRGENHPGDICIINECRIDEQGGAYTVHGERYRATI